jgi:ketosteroid isomerase-like protein
MTSKGTREVVEEFFSSLGSGDVEAALRLIDEPVDWFTPGSTELIPWMGHRTTRAEVREFFTIGGEHMSAEEFGVDRILVDGADAVALGHFKYRVNSTGKSFESDFALEIRVTGGLISRYHMHEDSYAISLAFLD